MTVINIMRVMRCSFHHKCLTPLACVLPVITGCASAEWNQRSADLRSRMREILVLPDTRVDLASETHGVIHVQSATTTAHEIEPTPGSVASFRIESITYQSEPGSRVTALLYLPEGVGHRVPAVVVACGHGGSKSAFYAQYAGQLYARLGFACLVPDTIGEEERQREGRMGARGHDLHHLKDDNPRFVREELKRTVLGKIVWDLMRGIDYLETRAEVDPSRIGIVGYSLGGASGGCVAMLDQRIDAAVIAGWVFRKRMGEYSKYCTRMPYAAISKAMTYPEVTALLAPHAATLFMIGEEDEVIDNDEQGAAAVRALREHLAGANQLLEEAWVEHHIEAEIEPGASHRPYFLSRRAIEWLQRYLMPPHERRPIPERTLKFGEWVDAQGRKIEKLYNTEKKERGLEVPAIGIAYIDSRLLACFPNEPSGGEMYTMQGWIESTVIANRDKPPLPDIYSAE